MKHAYNKNIMCGRYLFFDGKDTKIKQWIQLAQKSMKQEQYEKISLFDVHPGEYALTGYWNETKQETRITIMQWGFKMQNKLVINARSETCFESSFFKDALPCVLPADSYYEWSKNPHVKYAFATSSKPMYLAGIFHKEDGNFHFVILTEEAGYPQSEIHNRQPVIFTYEDAKKWCACKHPTSLLHNSISERNILSE